MGDLVILNEEQILKFLEDIPFNEEILRSIVTRSILIDMVIINIFYCAKKIQGVLMKTGYDF